MVIAFRCYGYRGMDDDEGVHTMESEEDEFAAIQRNGEVLKSVSNCCTDFLKFLCVFNFYFVISALIISNCCRIWALALVTTTSRVNV